MDHKTALNILRLSRLEKSAEAYREQGRQRGDCKRMARAASLEMAVYNASIGVMFQEVRPYRD